MKLTSTLFALLILMQSCRVYHEKPVTLEQSVKSENRVKIKTKDNKTMKFIKIIYDNNQYYGIVSKYVMLPLNKDELKSIRLYNPNLSMIYNIVLVPTIMVVSGLVIVLIGYSGPELGDGLQSPN